jgi:transcriptional regulator with XRE-family HTH domain
MLGKNKKTPSESFGETLRELRKESGLSQEALALSADLQRNYVSLIELGKNQPTVTTIFKLADALGISPSRLIKLTEDKLK